MPDWPPRTITWDGKVLTNFRTPTRKELRMPEPLSEDEVDGLRRWAVGFPFGDLTGAAVLRLLDEVTRARALLRRIEWAGMVPSSVCYEYTLGCTACEAREEDGKHAPDCELAALIGKV